MVVHQQPINQDEADALIGLYEFPNGAYNTYTLALKLHPTAKAGTPEAHTAFIKTRESTEQLIARGLVQGERARGVDGVYFNALKLTTKGEQSAILERTEAERSKKDREKSESLKQTISDIAAAARH